MSLFAASVMTPIMTTVIDQIRRPQSVGSKFDTVAGISTDVHHGPQSVENSDHGFRRAADGFVQLAQDEQHGKKDSSSGNDLSPETER